VTACALRVLPDKISANNPADSSSNKTAPIAHGNQDGFIFF
jgi:hypothetical protein